MDNKKALRMAVTLATAPAVPPEFTGGRKQKVNGKGGLLWTVRSEKSLDLSGSASPKPGQVV